MLVSLLGHGIYIMAALSLIQGKRCEIEEPLLVTANEQYTQLNN